NGARGRDWFARPRRTMKRRTVRGAALKIGIVNASSRFSRERGAAVEAWFARHLPAGVEAVIHPASYAEHGHFGGDDAGRAAAFVEFANDPAIDAIWFARGGYGACRIAEWLLRERTDVARGKRYLGYADAGTLLAALCRAGFPHGAHGPMASDALRGAEAGFRAMAWLTRGDP